MLKPDLAAGTVGWRFILSQCHVLSINTMFLGSASEGLLARKKWSLIKTEPCKTCQDARVGKKFPSSTTAAQEVMPEIGRWGGWEGERSGRVKGTSSGVNRRAAGWEKMFACCMSDKRS